MDIRKISNIRFYFQVVKSTANASADNEQILGEHVVVNKSPIEIRVPDKPFYPNDLYVFPKRVFGKQIDFVIQNGLNCTHHQLLVRWS